MKKKAKDMTIWILALFVVFGIMFLMFTPPKTDVPDKKDNDAGRPLVAAVCEGSPPFSYFDDQNKLAGFNIDYCAELSKRIGQPVEAKSVVWDTIIAGLQADKYDLIVGTMSITPERQKAVAFTDIYFTDGTTIAVAKDSPYKTAADLTGKLIGVGLGTNYEEDAKQYIKDPQIVTYKTDMEQYKDLELGRIDAVVCSRYGMQYAKVQGKMNYVIFADNLYDDPCGIALKIGNETLYEKVNAAVKEINSDGTYQKLIDKWFK